MQISISRLRAYTNCPQRFYYRYIEEAEPEFLSSHLLFGSAMHHAIAAFHESQNTIGSNGMNVEFEKYWNAQKQECELTQLELRLKGNEPDLRRLASDLCVCYVGQFKDLVPTSPDDVELLFEVPLFDPQSGLGTVAHTLTGKIDLVVDRSIYEFKTASRSPSQNDADCSIQLTAYALAYQFLFDEPAEHLYLVTLVKTKTPRISVRETTRTCKEYQYLVDMGINIARAIEAGIFYRNRETLYGCGTCEYEKTCLTTPDVNP